MHPRLLSRRARIVSVLAAATALLAGCTAPDPGAVASGASSAGHVVVDYAATTTPENETERRLLQDAGLLEAFAAWMEETVRLPMDITLVAKECQDANAFYTAQDSTITVCYELPASERVSLRADGTADADIDTQLLESAREVLFHEGGHALLAELDLAFTGREEDVADQFSVYALTGTEADTDSLITVAKLYYLRAQAVTTIDELPFSDTHGLDAQRSANFLCYVYGAAPDRYDYLVTDGVLDGDRAAGCPEEYAQLTAGWSALLAPFRTTSATS